ncbi:hypothetical protein BN137_1417 [Cronobacter condimenti 1330]|uniref:Uncharacterized protein n=1 Tax=Cronobacter condimenti 1330 TaxID=1073999 RepID=K7ZZ84_9ENTR|nr:hypothetical protein BN137_1417 [Cronobacter condimenti 1330]
MPTPGQKNRTPGADEPASIAALFDTFMTVYIKQNYLKFILLCHIFFISGR